MVRKKTEKKKKRKKDREVITVSGKRKKAVAKATVKKGTGKVKVNKKPLELFNFFHKLTLSEPLRIAEQTIGKVEADIDVNVKGGGRESQIEASRLAIARALIAFTKNIELRKAFLMYDRSLLVADTRRKEQRKPCRSKARAKRQKSYR